MWFKKNRLLLVLALGGGFLRFYKLDWGEGYFFHPDEYHIAASVDQLSFPQQMNPHFFSYGTFITYLIYFSRTLLGVFNSRFLSLNPILFGRFYSALFSTLTIPIGFLISQKLFKNRFYSYLATLLVAFQPGLIQQGHFATPESLLAFMLLVSLYFGLSWLEKNRLSLLYFAAIFLGLALGTKIVSLTFLPILLLFPWLKMRLKLIKKPIYLIKLIILPLLIVFSTFFFVFPFSLLDWQDFCHSMNYEIGVGRGKPVVFYTRQFINTSPIIFQLQKILPFALGPGLLILGILGLTTIIIEIIQTLFKKQTINTRLLIILLAFSLYFFPNVFLFAKWTRFIAPTFPFFALFTSHFLSKMKNKFLLTICYLLLVTCFFWMPMFFSIYLRPDVRISATTWLNQHLSSRSFILTESGNMLEVPLQGALQKRSFDFYHLEESQNLQSEFPSLLVKADYFIIQSRRIFLNHQRLSQQFPKTSRFYDLLFSDQLGFKKIKEFNAYPKLEIGNWKLEIPDEVGEETWSVFDHPVIRIYKKVKPLSSQDYESLLQI